MKVVFINSVFNEGSTGKLAYEQKEYFEKKGVECYVFFGRGSITSEKIKRIQTRSELYTHILITRLFDKHGLGSKRATYRLINQLKQIKPDCIFLHNIHGYYLNYNIFFDFLNNEYHGKVIWVFHDTWPISGHSAYINELREPLGIALGEERKEYPKSWFINRSKSNLKLKRKLFSTLNFTIISPSYWLGSIVKKSFLGNKDIIVINNGINPEKFYLDNKILKCDKRRLLAVANIWENRKGLEYINMLAEDEEFSDIEIIVIGKLPSGKHLSDKIKHIPRTENLDDLRYYYNISDVFVNPTLDDNFPTTNIEALMCGLPVITFNTGGSPECIIDEIMGTVVEKENFLELKKSVIDLLEKSSKEKKKEISTKASIFSQEDMLKKYFDLLKDSNN